MANFFDLIESEVNGLEEKIMGIWYEVILMAEGVDAIRLCEKTDEITTRWKNEHLLKSNSLCLYASLSIGF